MKDYHQYLSDKAHASDEDGFEPYLIPGWLFPHQKALTEWAVRKGRAAIYADCGLGKTPMALVWADNVVRHTVGRVLILTPLAVAAQFVEEGAKFDIDVHRIAGEDMPDSGIFVTNYERLKHLNPEDFTGLVCDESSILKNYGGARRNEITQFVRKIRYRLLATATAAPNDYHELGTSSEALGYLGYMDMLNRFFRNDMNNSATGRIGNAAIKWRLKGHAERPFWRWVCSWARACRKPSDLGFPDDGFDLPPLVENVHAVKSSTLAEGFLFDLPAVGLDEQREERKRTITERCEKMAEIALNGDGPALMWCHLNAEGDLLEKLIPGAVQVSGRDNDEQKERKLMAFSHGDIRYLITKPKIGAWGLNFQHCNRVITFPSHSFEQYYQSIRRCWRFGQKNPVTVDIITTEGESDVLKNLQRKSGQADEMFANLVGEMNKELSIIKKDTNTNRQELPSWL